MSRQVSIGTMIKQITGLRDSDLSDFERGFVANISRLTNFGQDTTRLSDRQIEVIENIFRKNFA